MCVHGRFLARMMGKNHRGSSILLLSSREERLGDAAVRIWNAARKQYLEICRTTRFRRESKPSRNLFTALIIVFRPVQRRRSCSTGAVNGLTTNRRDLHGITNAFATNLFSRVRPVGLSLTVSLPRSRASLYLRFRKQFSSRLAVSIA